MNNEQRKALADFLAEDGWVVTKAAVDEVVAQIRADVEEGVLREMPEDVAELPDVDAYIDDAVNAVYSRTGDDKITRAYRDALEDAVDLTLQQRLGFAADDEHWMDVEEKSHG